MSNLIDVLKRLQFHKDKAERHPEKDVLNHSLQAYFIAKKESNDKLLWVAALFHDIGKQIETLSHDKYSVDILKSFGYKNKKVLWLIENHIRVIWFLDGTMEKQKKMQELLKNIWFKDLIHLRRIDNSARSPNKNMKLTDNLINEINILIWGTNE